MNRAQYSNQLAAKNKKLLAADGCPDCKGYGEKCRRSGLAPCPSPKCRLFGHLWRPCDHAHKNKKPSP